MHRHHASLVRSPWNLVTLPHGPGLVDPHQTLESVQQDKPDVTAQIELQRWEDDGGAIVSPSRHSAAGRGVAHFDHLEAA